MASIMLATRPLADVQDKIGYWFCEPNLLTSALKAAEKDNVAGVHDDGNRRLAAVGSSAMDLVMTRNMIDILEETKSINALEHWSKSKRGRADACKALGLDRCIVQSVRQNQEPPSSNVLAYALSAIIGAIWIDLEASKTACEMMDKILSVLKGIDAAIANESTSQITLEPSIAHRGLISTDHVHTVDQSQNSLQQNRNATTQEELEGRMPLDDDFSQSPLQDQSAEPQIRDLITTSIRADGHMLDPGPSSWPHVNQEDGNIEQDVSHHGTESLDSRVIDCDQTMTDYPDVPSSLCSSSGTARFPTPRPDAGRRAAPNQSLHNQLMAKELAKIWDLPILCHSVLKELLDHDEIEGLSQDAYQASQLRLLYFGIGSCQSLQEFQKILHHARRNPNIGVLPSDQSVYGAQRLHVIDRLEDTESLCTLLKRYHCVKLFEEEATNYDRSRTFMTIETPNSFVNKSGAVAGNPDWKRGAEVTDTLLRKIKPQLRSGTPEYITYRSRLKRYNQLAKILQMLTDIYGYGILALLPNGPLFTHFDLTDNMLRSFTETRLRQFIMIVDAAQGSVLRELSKAVEPALIALVSGTLTLRERFPIELVASGVFEDLPKGAGRIVECLYKSRDINQQ